MFRAPSFTYEEGYYVWHLRNGTWARSVHKPERRTLPDYLLFHLFWSYGRTIHRIYRAFRHKESK